MANHESQITPQLQNVVATVNLGTKLDLKEIALHARNAEYNPKARRACAALLLHWVFTAGMGLGTRLTSLNPLCP